MREQIFLTRRTRAGEPRCSPPNHATRMEVKRAEPVDSDSSVYLSDKVVRGDERLGFSVLVGRSVVAIDLSAREARDVCEVLRARGKKPVISMG